MGISQPPGISGFRHYRVICWFVLPKPSQQVTAVPETRHPYQVSPVVVGAGTGLLVTWWRAAAGRHIFIRDGARSTEDQQIVLALFIIPCACSSSVRLKYYLAIFYEDLSRPRLPYTSVIDLL